jgi:hypothetical protein
MVSPLRHVSVPIPPSKASVPSPPSSWSLPSLPITVSSPPAPKRKLSWASPLSVSPKSTEPTTFSIPVSVSVPSPDGGSSGKIHGHRGGREGEAGEVHTSPAVDRVVSVLRLEGVVRVTTRQDVVEARAHDPFDCRQPVRPLARGGAGGQVEGDCTGSAAIQRRPDPGTSCNGHWPCARVVCGSSSMHRLGDCLGSSVGTARELRVDLRPRPRAHP